MAVVKSNAYGHGLREVTRALAGKVDYFGVARLREGIELRDALPDVPILVFGGFFSEQTEQFLTYNLDLTVFDRERAVLLSERAQALGRSARVHVKVDTGMTRVGIHWSEAIEFIQWMNSLDGISLVGVYTHFATSDEPETSYAMTQLAQFDRVMTGLRQTGITSPMFHAANSGAILNLPKSHLDMVRPGIALYGHYPSPNCPRAFPLRPALTFKSRVLAVQSVERGTDIGYNRTYQTTAPTRIAIVPAGYGDGYNRLLSNRGDVLIGGQRCPVVGRISMDLTAVDTGLTLPVSIGDEVVLLGRQGDAEITMEEICAHLKTIPYEVTCWISSRVSRRYIS